MKRTLAWLRWRGILLLAALTPPCREIARLASQARERPPTLWMRLRLRIHCWICAACERYRRQLDVLQQAARQSVEHPPPALPSARLAAAARQRIRERLRGERGGD
jgi:hypothetical protein